LIFKKILLKNVVKLQRLIFACACMPRSVSYCLFENVKCHLSGNKTYGQRSRESCVMLDRLCIY